MPEPQALLQKLRQGLLPLLLQKMQGEQTKPQASSQAPPQSAQAGTPQTQAQPGVGGAPPGVKYDPSGAGASMPPPIAQPHEAVQSIAGLLMNWNNRKKKGEEAEAANIAQNLIQALRNNDKDTVNDILNNDHSKKILNKVYKGWLTKMEEAQKPGKEPDPTVSGFEAGIQKATQGQQQPRPPQGQPQGPPPPGTAGGYRLPQPSQAEKLGAAETSAKVQTFQQDPNLMKPTQLTSEELRETQLGAGPEKVAAEKARAEAVVKKAASDLQKAQLEVQKSEAELKIKQTEGATAETKGKIATDVERNKYLKSVVDLDIARERLKLSIAKTKAGTNLSFITKLKMAAIDKAIAITSKIQDEKRSFSTSDFGNLATELRAAGATELIKKLPQNWLSAHLLYGKGDVTDLLEALQHYKESYQKVVDDVETPSGKKGATASGEEEGDEGEEVDADIVVDPKDMEEKPPEKP